MTQIERNQLHLVKTKTDGPFPPFVCERECVCAEADRATGPDWSPHAVLTPPWVGLLHSPGSNYQGQAPAPGRERVTKIQQLQTMLSMGVGEGACF